MSDLLAYAARIAPPKRDVYAALLRIDAELVAADFPPLSEWWRDTLKGFYESRKRRIVLRVGRRGGKSSSLCRVAVAEVLHGDHKVPPGDVGVFAFVSVKRADASERLRTIAEILDVLKVPHEQSGDEIRIPGTNRLFRVYTANYRTSVGMTLIGLVADEVARWRDDDTGANPATEILRSMRPAMLTMRNAHEFLSSSPFSTIDAHHEAFERGNTDEQAVAWAPTWIAHPEQTEARCRELEPDEPTFRREYGAEPMGAGLSSFLDARAIDAAIHEYDRAIAPGDMLTAGADFGFRRDSSALVTVRRRESLVVPLDIVEMRPDREPLKPSEVVKRFAESMKARQLRGVMADGHYRQSIMEHLETHDLAFIDAPTDVPETYVRFRVMLHQGNLRLPKHDRLIRDLKEVQSRPTAAGRLSILLPRRPGGGHADMVSALVLACWQRVGTEIPKVPDMPDGWTQAELDDVGRMIARRRADRGESWYDDQSAYEEVQWGAS